MIAYSGFTMAACFGFLQLFKNKVSVSRIGSGVALMILLNLGIAGGNEMFKTGYFYMARTVERTAPDGTLVKVKDTYRDEATGQPVTRMERVPHAHWFYHLAVLSFLGSALLLWTRRRKDVGALDWAGWGPKLFALGLLSIFGLMGMVGWGISTKPELTLYSNPYLTVLMIMTVFMGLMYWVMAKKYNAFVAALPSQQRLEELEYKNILFSFPFQTLLLITGAIWAYYAWGRSWGWDPKETWALITWFAFLIYLHGKLLLNWKSNILSVLAIVGFVIMVFAFLGVNLVLSGLHSYGAA
jgi:ABC-type transport system involved in cytochrome c biogenesis permease subunit